MLYPSVLPRVSGGMYQVHTYRSACPRGNCASVAKNGISAVQRWLAHVPLRSHEQLIDMASEEGMTCMSLCLMPLVDAAGGTPGGTVCTLVEHYLADRLLVARSKVMQATRAACLHQAHGQNTTGAWPL